MIRSHYVRSTTKKHCTEAAAAGGLPGYVAASSGSHAHNADISISQVDGHEAASAQGHSRQRQRLSWNNQISHLEELLSHCHAHIAELEAQRQVWLSVTYEPEPVCRPVCKPVRRGCMLAQLTDRATYIPSMTIPGLTAMAERQEYGPSQASGACVSLSILPCVLPKCQSQSKAVVAHAKQPHISTHAHSTALADARGSAPASVATSMHPPLNLTLHPQPHDAPHRPFKQRAPPCAAGWPACGIFWQQRRPCAMRRQPQ